MPTEDRLITVITALVVLAVMLVAPVSRGAQIARASPGVPIYHFPASSDSFEVNLSKWDENGTTDWDLSTSRYRHGSQSVRANGDNDGHVTTYLADRTGTIASCERRTWTITNDDEEQAPVQAVISLTKTATDGAGHEVTEAHVGDTIVYVFKVENPGVPGLTSVTLTDDTGICDVGPVRGADEAGDNDDTLEPGEIWVYTCSHLVTPGDPDPLDNHATVSGAPTVAGTQAIAEATSTVRIISKDPMPVGGMVTPVDKATLLAPWIALFVAIAFGAITVTRYHRIYG